MDSKWQSLQRLLVSTLPTSQSGGTSSSSRPSSRGSNGALTRASTSIASWISNTRTRRQVDMRGRDAARGRYNDFDESRLCCYGCAHSAAGQPWPGAPSGEAPCGFCIRNPLQHLEDEEAQVWYDGSEPVSVPMDCYSTIDMRMQFGVWL